MRIQNYVDGIQTERVSSVTGGAPAIECGRVALRLNWVAGRATATERRAAVVAAIVVVAAPGEIGRAKMLRQPHGVRATAIAVRHPHGAAALPACFHRLGNARASGIQSRERIQGDRRLLEIHRDDAVVRTALCVRIVRLSLTQARGLRPDHLETELVDDKAGETDDGAPQNLSPVHRGSNGSAQVIEEAGVFHDPNSVAMIFAVTKGRDGLVLG